MSTLYINYHVTHASATQDFINLFSSFGYQKLISKPTRVVREGCTIKSSTLIDNIDTNINYWNDGISGVLHSDDVIGNDHKIIFYIRRNSTLPKFKKYRIQRDFCLKNVYYIKIKWQDLYEQNLADKAFTYFITYIKICSTSAVLKKKSK